MSIMSSNSALSDFAAKYNSKSSTLTSSFGGLSDSLSSSLSTFGNKIGSTSRSLAGSRYSLLSNTEETNESNSGWLYSASKDPCFPSLGKKQRIIGFMLFLTLSAICFALSTMYLPILILKSRKFGALYSLGSLFAISSFSMLYGPVNHAKHLITAERIPFTILYFGTLGGTLYFSLWVKSTLVTLVFAVAQMLTLVSFIVSYIPGGQTGLKFFSRLCCSCLTRTAQSTLPV